MLDKEMQARIGGKFVRDLPSTCKANALNAHKRSRLLRCMSEGPRSFFNLSSMVSISTFEAARSGTIPISFIVLLYPPPKAPSRPHPTLSPRQLGRD
jgi:hypothetical protein